MNKSHLHPLEKENAQLKEQLEREVRVSLTLSDIVGGRVERIKTLEQERDEARDLARKYYAKTKTLERQRDEYKKSAWNKANRLGLLEVKIKTLEGQVEEYGKYSQERWNTIQMAHQFISRDVGYSPVSLPERVGKLVDDLKQAQEHNKKLNRHIVDLEGQLSLAVIEEDQRENEQKERIAKLEVVVALAKNFIKRHGPTLVGKIGYSFLRDNLNKALK